MGEGLSDRHDDAGENSLEREIPAGLMDHISDNYPGEYVLLDKEFKIIGHSKFSKDLQPIIAEQRKTQIDFIPLLMYGFTPEERNIRRFY